MVACVYKRKKLSPRGVKLATLLGKNYKIRKSFANPLRSANLHSTNIDSSWGCVCCLFVYLGEGKGMGVTASWFPAAESNALFVTRTICIRRSPENKHIFGLVEDMEMETAVQLKRYFVVTTPSEPDVASSCRMSRSVFCNLHRLHSNGFLSPRPMSLAPYVSAWAPALG